MPERQWLCTLQDWGGETAIYAETRSKARYRYWLNLRDSCPDIPLTAVRVRTGAPHEPPSDGWRRLGLTERQRHIARHALGWDGRHKQSYRNHYVIGEGGDTHSDWVDLVERGLATRVYSAPCRADVFRCTRQLALAVRDNYERLNTEYAYPTARNARLDTA